VPKEKLYVWFDAPIGYISLKNGLYEKERLGTYWKDKDTKLVFYGKDNIVFIASSSAMLKAKEAIFYQTTFLQMSS
jgi:methionyl-tRNA synthetase